MLKIPIWGRLCQIQLVIQKASIATGAVFWSSHSIRQAGRNQRGGGAFRKPFSEHWQDNTHSFHTLLGPSRKKNHSSQFIFGYRFWVGVYRFLGSWAFTPRTRTGSPSWPRRPRPRDPGSGPRGDLDILSHEGTRHVGLKTLAFPRSVYSPFPKLIPVPVEQRSIALGKPGPNAPPPSFRASGLARFFSSIQRHVGDAHRVH